MDIQSLFTPPDITRAITILCIQPHPDDNEIGMGGTVAAFAARGCKVHYLTVTTGDLGLFAPEMTHAELAATRKAEAMAAGKRLNVQTFQFMDEPDGSLSDIPSLAGKIAEVIRTVQPEAVFCPDPWVRYEAHYDHIAVGLATAQAFIACTLMHYPRGTQTEPWLCPAIGFYYTQAPNTVLDVSATFEAQLAAMAEHRSQFAGDQLQMYRALLTQRGQKLGATKGFAIGEGFKVLNGYHLHCFPEAPMI